MYQNRKLSLNWEPKMDVIERSIIAWTMRNLTMVDINSEISFGVKIIGSILNLPT